MTALIGFIAVTAITGLIVRWQVDWHAPPAPRRTSFDLADNARKIQAILSSLAGFAVTSMVLLITFAGSRLDMNDERTVDVLALLVVAYLGFVVAAIMYAHTEPIVAPDGTELLPAQHAIASTQFYRSILSGWLALGPLIALVGIDKLTVFVLFWLLVAVLGGWIFHAANLTATGYGGMRFVVVSPALAIGGAFVYAGIVQLVPGLRSPDSVLFITGAGAAMGAAAHFSFHAMRAAGDRLPGIWTRNLRALAIMDSHASVALVTFVWMAIAGLI